MGLTVLGCDNELLAFKGEQSDALVIHAVAGIGYNLCITLLVLSHQHSMNRMLLAQLARLLKSILLIEVPGAIHPPAQFGAGKRTPLTVFSRPGMSWWYCDQTFLAKSALASLLKESDLSFKDCDIESVERTIMETLQEICLDEALFDGDDVFFRQKPNLFECHRSELALNDFAARIVDAIKDNLRTIIGRRCTLYPLPRYMGPSFRVPGLGLWAVSRTDLTTWEVFEKQDYLLDGWSPSNPVMKTPGDRALDGAGAHYFLISEEVGTQQGAKFASAVKLRTLIALMFSVVVSRQGRGFWKSAAPASTVCVQFPHRSSTDLQTTLSELGALSPHYVSDLKFDSEAINVLLAWYRKREACTPEFGQRLDKAAYFINRGMNADDIESYINNFVALDALFGEQGSVEASIKAGVLSLALGADLENRVSWLFDLRNELVHGGSRYIAEWPEYQRYVRHFKSQPLADVAKLAQSAILAAPARHVA